MAERESLQQRAARLHGAGLSWRECAAAEGMEFMAFMRAVHGEPQHRIARNRARRPEPIRRDKPGVTTVVVEASSRGRP